MPKLDEYVRGSLISVDTLFTTRTGVDPDGKPIYTPTDPDTITFFLEAPDGVVTPYTYPSPNVIRDGVGAYHAEVKPNLKGIWQFKWESTGAAEGADQGAFRIVDDLEDLFDFLVLPEDWNAIRAVLGMTEADMPNETIEASTFAGQAEQRVKNRVSNWEEQLLDPDRHYALRMATAYATAALIAESYAKGGVIGNAYGARIIERANFDWNHISALMWQRHEEWIAMAEAWDVVPEVTFALPMVKASGPSKSNVPRPVTVPPWTGGVVARWRGWTV